MIGSRHEDGDRYRQELVRPRLDRNAQLQRDLRLDAPPQWLRVNGIMQPMHAVMIDAQKINDLMSLIVLGLYYHHYGEPLDKDFTPEASMFRPEHEPFLWEGVEKFFPPAAQRFQQNLGRGSFIYVGVRSPAVAGFSAWQLAWHGGIRLHGQGAPPEGVGHWWAFTRPTPEALAESARI